MKQPHPPSPKRPTWIPIILAVAAFYVAVFAALEVVGFEFPLPILAGFFVLAAIPAGIVVVGLMYLVVLLRMQFGRTPPAPLSPVRAVSAFIGTTVLVSAYFVIIYPIWREQAAIEVAAEIAGRLDTTTDANTRAQVEEAVRSFWDAYMRQVSIKGGERVMQDPDVKAAVTAVMDAAIDETIDADERDALLTALAAAARALPQTAPRAATGPAGSAPALGSDLPAPPSTVTTPRTDGP